jgi:hypothetical protein
MMSRNQHRWMKLEAIVQKDLLLKELQTVVGVGQRIQERAASFGVPIMETDADNMCRFSVPPNQVAASLLTIFGYNLTRDILGECRRFTLQDLWTNAASIGDQFFLDLAECGDWIGRTERNGKGSPRLNSNQQICRRYAADKSIQRSAPKTKRSPSMLC